MCLSAACCTSQVCQCENVGFCGIQTDYRYEWVDIIGTDPAAPIGTRIDNGMWEQNNDDGWYHVTLPFDFNWFGVTERIITIGTNGVLTFGTGQLPYGSSEPVPCTYGDVACHGDDNAADGTMAAEGVIAPFWTDLNPDVTGVAAGTGVYYNVYFNPDPRISDFNRMVVEYKVPPFGGTATCHFEVILMAEGSVIMQYQDMPADGGWSTESIGFEDQSGMAGVQISYGEVPAPRTAYRIPPGCHTPAAGVRPVSGCAAQCGAAFTAADELQGCTGGCTNAVGGMNFFACSAQCHTDYSRTQATEGKCIDMSTQAIQSPQRDFARF